LLAGEQIIQTAFLCFFHLLNVAFIGAVTLALFVLVHLSFLSLERGISLELLIFKHHFETIVTHELLHISRFFLLFLPG